MPRFVLAAFVIVALGCHSSGSTTTAGSPPTPASREQSAPTDGAPSVAADYYPYSKPGNGVIDGQAFVVVRGGDVILDDRGYLTTISDNARTASTSDVTLDPATPYAMTWYMKEGTSLRRFNNAPKDAAFRAARKKTIADEAGRFKFEGLPPGRYIIRTTITWETPRDSYRMMRQGGVASAVIELAENETKKVIIRQVSEQP